MNITMVLDMATSADPERVVLGRPGDGMTYSDLYRQAGVAGERLHADGIRHLAFVGPNSPAFGVAVFAAAWAGIPLLPLNYRLPADQVVGLLDVHDDVLVLSHPTTADVVRGSRHPVLDRDDWLATTDIGEPTGTWAQDGDAIAVLLYTSGTTSAPKAAVLRHRHLLSYLFAAVPFGESAETDATVVAVPPYHIAGVANLLSNLYSGRRIVYLDGFTPTGWLETVRKEAATHAMVVPTMLARIVAEADGRPADTPSLRTLSYGGAKIAPSIIAQALEIFPTTGFVNAYGLTETSSTIAVLGPEDHREAVNSADPAVRARLGSAGKLVPGTIAEIRDDAGARFPAGTSGSLWVKGDQVSGEYLAADSPLDADGWFPTRDRAYFDQAGYLFIEGRSDDTIIRGGENTAPAEIEAVLMQHPAVGDAAVVGVPDPEWGHRIAAVVVAEEGVALDLEELRAFARVRLRTAKTPEQWEAWPELPYTTTGKLLRREVLAQLQQADGTPPRP
ncbi:class I adenylate-forming enzyme family protein [Pseudonocardia sp. GCM10023141]|uniref:class I adenylate-forming enzyme family protein n=1 Tax=Pseudonocardia sp. GCM10023141 TaxID=3252653 RepID=UPI00360B8827